MTTLFSEVNLFEQGREADSFFSTGSVASIGETPGSFSKSLLNKEQIRISFNVESKTTMLADSGSIYYFSPKNKAWQTTIGINRNLSGPFENISLITNNTRGSSWFEDFFVFDPYGNSVASGSYNIRRNVNPAFVQGGFFFSQKLDDTFHTAINQWNRNSVTDYASRDYPKSFTRNSDFDAGGDFTFELPVQNSFLIEKVSLQIPFCFGKTWFSDKTITCRVTSSANDYLINGSPASIGNGFGPLNTGGPGVTVSLFSEKIYGTQKIRDLICKKLITHVDDSLKTCIFTYDAQGWRLISAGIDPDLYEFEIVQKNNNTFTGSVQINSTCEASNGLHCFSTDETGILPISAARNFLSSSLLSEYVNIQGINANNTKVKIYGVDPFGRGMTGFSPSGGSIFGGEYITATSQIFTKDNKVKNPLYIKDDTLRQQNFATVSANFDTNPDYISISEFVYIGSSKVSPYLVNPGERILLVVTKNRPAMINCSVKIDNSVNPNAENFGIATWASGSYFFHDVGKGHDVQFNTGSINITFYGSYVRAGNSYVP